MHGHLELEHQSAMACLKSLLANFFPFNTYVRFIPCTQIHKDLYITRHINPTTTKEDKLCLEIMFRGLALDFRIVQHS